MSENSPLPDLNAEHLKAIGGSLPLKWRRKLALAMKEQERRKLVVMDEGGSAPVLQPSCAVNSDSSSRIQETPVHMSYLSWATAFVSSQFPDQHVTSAQPHELPPSHDTPESLQTTKYCPLQSSENLAVEGGMIDAYAPVGLDVLITTKPSQRGQTRFPPELWLEIFKHVKQQDILAALAAACKDFLSIVEEFLYRNVTIYSPAALSRFWATLNDYPRKVRLVQTLVVDWPEKTKIGECTADHFVAMLRHFKKLGGRLDRLDVKVWSSGLFCTRDTFDYALLLHEDVMLPRSLKTMDGPISLLKSLQQPYAPLAALSLCMRITELAGIYPYLNNFRNTLRSLRLRRCMPWKIRYDSPARVFAGLDAPKLEYLEIQDESSRINPPYRKGRCDAVWGSELYEELLAGTPGIRRLVWAPTWSRGGEDQLLPGGDYHATLIGFKRDLFETLQLEELTIVIAGNRCIRFDASTNEEQAKPLAMEISEDAWRML